MAVVIHNIKGHYYAYEHHREGKKVVTDYIGPVGAGSTSKSYTTLKPYSGVSKPEVKQQFKPKNEDIFLMDKQDLANKIADREKIHQVAVFKNGQRQKLFNSSYEANQYIDQNATDAELKQDGEVKRMGYTKRFSRKAGKNIVINKPVWSSQIIGHKTKIKNMDEVQKIMSEKDQERFYTKTRPKYG